MVSELLRRDEPELPALRTAGADGEGVGAFATHESLTPRAAPSSFGRMSRLPFELLLALRYLRPKRTFVSVITLISVLGVTLGVAVLIIVISVMSGFDKQLRDKILGFNTHLKIAAPRRDDEGLCRRCPHGGLQPQRQGGGAVRPGPRAGARPNPPAASPGSARPYLRGIVPQIETNMSVLPSSIVEGKFDVSDRGLLIGT